ncbi:polyphosphate--glucose phosphotransferase [Pseudoclavibacter albus]|uniref:polyphosphate--glucose phosphotransferase n=1 Tax=Pseudoclavibacter albus TaxID=272241 RepID=UPI0028834D1A|nr:ROK family protein [Pseudoclavibacter alba]
MIDHNALRDTALDDADDAPEQQHNDELTPPTRAAIGIDIGGTGIKGAVVNLETGELLSKRKKISTPEGAEPEDILSAVMELSDKLRKHKSIRGSDHVEIGICLPSIVRHGVTHSAANISKRWLGLHAEHLFSDGLGQAVALANDADAAGLGEQRFGAAHGRLDSVLVTTLGTGIGTALIHGGHLFPNTELGHLELDGHADYERFASARAREIENLNFEAWGARLTPYYRKLEQLFCPDVFILSGGISKQAEEFLHLIEVQTPIIPAALRNNAGIIGAAILADEAASLRADADTPATH